MSNTAQPTNTAARLRSFVERVERLDEVIKDANSDKSDVYTEAKSDGFDVKVLKAVISYRRKDPDEVRERQTVFETYLAAIESGTPVATRVRARPNPPTDATDGITEPVTNMDRGRAGSPISRTDAATGPDIARSAGITEGAPSSRDPRATLVLSDPGPLPEFLDRRQRATA